MYKIVNTPEDKTLPKPGTDIFSRSENIRKGANNYTLPGDTLLGSYYNVLKSTNYGIKSVAVPTGDTSTLKDLADDLSNAILLPPSEDYSTIIPPEGVNAAQQIEEVTRQQMVQKFYETYMVPIGCKDIYNRLGNIAGNITDVHTLYPSGIKGLIAADSRASWKINTNYSFTIQGKLGNEKYSSLGFPPFMSRNASDLEDLYEDLNPGEDSGTFDMENVLYKGNAATFRFPAFKQVNDNINFLQVLLNRCFGVESTYINEWDMSIYMQEGILSFIEKADAEGGTVRLPQFVTTLTYGLLDDAPVEGFGKGEISSEEINLDKATPFASVNCAISTRYGIDNEALGQQANTLNYVIADYPYSAYWYPRDEGATSFDMNVSIYIDKLLSYRDNGEAYNEKNPTGHWYTPAIFHGTDLSKSTKTFRSILGYTDHRNAILSGWNSTDENGTVYQPGSDRTNESIRSNAYAYLPFWKQFYTNSDDGLSDIDKYIQEIYAKDSEVSFINAAYQIIGMMTSGNGTFQDFCSEHNPSAVGEIEENGEAIDTSATSTAANYGADDYSDYGFKLFKCKLSIPGSKLLKMFLNRNKQKDKAMSQADAVGGGNIDDPSAGAASGGGSASPSAAAKNATPSKSLGEPTTTLIDGQEVEVNTYVPEDNDDLASKKTVGDGIAEWSPMLYGGPHGKYDSPLTLEGFSQYNNQMLANVPTVDPYAVFAGKTLLSQGSIRGLEFTKNWKKDGSYIDTVTCVTPNEREVLLKQTDGKFGVKHLGPNTWHWFSYYSNVFPREYFWDTQKWIEIELLWWTLRIPNFFYFKICRTHNGSWDRGLYFPYDYGTASYNTRFDTSKLENDVSAQEDWVNEDFRLIPTCAKQHDFNSYSENSCWNSEKTIEQIKIDESKFREMTDWKIDSSSGAVIYTKKADDCNRSDYILKDGNRVDYMVVPVSIGSDVTCGELDADMYPFADHRFLHWTTYSAPGSKWYNQLQNMYKAGTRELTISLPIVDSKSYDKPITNIVAGVANIEKSRGIGWTWKLVAERHLCYRYYGWWWWRYSRSYWCYHYKWVLVRRYEDTYNMYFKPNKVQWNVPTGTILNREAIYTDQRDPNSVNIVERWCTDGANDATAKRFSSIGSGEGYSPKLFPFTLDYLSRYGASEPGLPLPGVVYGGDKHVRTAGSIGILHTKGLYWQDILQSYKTKGYVESIKSVKAIYKTFTEPRTYYDTAAGVRYNMQITIGGWTINLNPLADLFRFFFGAFYERKSTFSVQRELFWTAYNPVWVVDQLEKQTELTNIFDRAQSWPTIQEYQVNRRPFMTWYKPTDTIGVFIDTAKQQISWLEQLRDYAELYLSDKLIWEVYQKGVDQRIQSIIEYNYVGDSKNGQDYKTGCGGWTESFTEDINYHDALAIARRVFKTTDPEKNTLYDLTDKRIQRFEALIAAAEKIKATFDSAPTAKMQEFMNLVTNTRAYLECAVSDGVAAEDSVFDASGNYVDQLFPIYDSNDSSAKGTTTYNLLRNPGAVLWAYLNVLYQVRKYWVNMRFNKRAGSYWQLRGLERVLTFMLAEKTGEDSAFTPEKHIPQGTSEELKTKSIVFVQPRDGFMEQVNGVNSLTTNTKAIYTKVNYLGTPNPTKSAKWDAESQTYSGEEIVYVNEAYRWAKKPQDGLYYIMSKAITDTVEGLMNSLRSANNLISARTYKVTADDIVQVKNLLRSADLSEVLANLGLYVAEDKAHEQYDEVNAFTNSEYFDQYEDYIDALSMETKTLTQIEKDIDTLDAEKYNKQVASNVLSLFINLLVTYKRAYYLEQAKSYLYAIYIKWQPSQVWTGLDEQDDNGSWHIDEWQKQHTAGKERVVTDLYGYDHKSTEAISAGITFDVAAAINADNLLSSPSIMRDSSLLEVLCSAVDNMDLWRVELPEALEIPVSLLSEKPVLVPAYQIDSALSGLTAKKVTKSTKSVLAGISSNSILPVLEPTESMLSVDSLSALGKFNDISQTGMSVESLQGSGN